jgi:uncharacterized membrane protein
MIKEYSGADSELLFEDKVSAIKSVLPKLDLKRIDPRLAICIVAPIIAGVGLIWFGLTTTGSFWTPATKFGGSLALIWYGYQLGNLLAMIGTVLIYDAIKRTGYL